MPGPLSKDDLLYNVHGLHRMRILISASLKFCVKVHLPATVAENLDHEPCSPWRVMADPKVSHKTDQPVRRKKLPSWTLFGPVLVDLCLTLRDIDGEHLGRDPGRYWLISCFEIKCF